MSSTKKLTLNGFRQSRFFYEFTKWTGAIPMLLFLRPKVKFVNKKAYKKLKGAFLMSCNHRSLWDPIILCTAFPPKRLYFVAQEELFSTKKKAWLFSQCNCIKIDRQNVDMETFRTIGKVLKNDLPVCIFPEGRVEEKEGASFKGGGAMIALTNNVPVLPVWLGMRKSILHRYRVYVGEPIYPDDVVGKSRSLMSIDKFNNYIFEKEKELENILKQEK